VKGVQKNVDVTAVLKGRGMACGGEEKGCKIARRVPPSIFLSIGNWDQWCKRDRPIVMQTGRRAQDGEGGGRAALLVVMQEDAGAGADAAGPFSPRPFFP
jgi:hypothetical protein